MGGIEERIDAADVCVMEDGKMYGERRLEGKILKPYAGFVIEKSWEVMGNGKIDKESIIYTAYTKGADGETDGVADVDKILEKYK